MLKRIDALLRDKHDTSSDAEIQLSCGRFWVAGDGGKARVSELGDKNHGCDIHGFIASTLRWFRYPFFRQFSKG